MTPEVELLRTGLDAATSRGAEHRDESGELLGRRFALDDLDLLDALPRRAGELGSLWAEIATRAYPTVAFESPQRLPATLCSLADYAPEAPVAVCRELTKHFEEVVRGTAQKFKLSGAPAVAVALKGANPSTKITERVTVVGRQLSDKRLIYLVFVVPDKEAQSYGPVLEAMVNSLQVNESVE